jgi:hypothetical protein
MRGESQSGCNIEIFSLSAFRLAKDEYAPGFVKMDDNT